MDAAIVWQGEAPNDRGPLEDWAHERGLKIVVPRENAKHLAYSEESASAIEHALAVARDATAQLDVEGAERSLARAEGILRAHPELPQAPWLMAEVQRGWAARFARIDPKDEARATRALLAANAIDGGRATGVGETRGPLGSAVEIVFDGVRDPDLQFLLDARPIPIGPLRVIPGEHHISAVVSGSTRWSEWITIAEGMRVELPDVAPVECSREDLARATPRCANWISAKTEGDHVRASLCHRAACEPSLLFSSHFVRTPPVTEPQRGRGLRIPGWIVWTGGALVVLGGTFSILAAAGVFSTHSTAPPVIWGSGPPIPQ